MKYSRTFFDRYRRILGMILCFVSALGTAQDLEFQHLSVKQGLSQGNVQDIHQDRFGFIWIGTEDGLNVYDGYSVRVFRNDPEDSSSISNNNVFRITEDSIGNLWIGTREGLNLYDRKSSRFKRFLIHEGTQNASTSAISAVVIDSKHNLWVGTGNGIRLYNLKTKTFKNFLHDPDKPNSVAGSEIRCILEDSQKRIWVGTIGGLSLLNKDGNSFTNFYHSPVDRFSLSANKIHCLFEDRNHLIWIGTENGLNVKDPTRNSFTQYFHKGTGVPSLVDNYIYHVTEDKVGNLWISTDGGLNMMNTKDRTFAQYVPIQKNKNSLSSSIVTKAIFDFNERMWIATRYGGVNIYDKGKSKFTHYNHDPFKNSLSNDIVMSFEDDRNGNFWVATDGGGLNYFDRKSKTFTTFPKTFTNDKILTLEKDSHKLLWLGMWGGGINSFDPRTKQVRRYLHDPNNKKSLSDNRIFDIMEDRRGDMWIATWGNGVSRYNRATDDFTQFTHDPQDLNSISRSGIVFLLEDSHGKIWMATETQGINILDPATNKIIRYKKGQKNGELTGNYIYALYEDSQKRIWVGTLDGGLNLYDSQTKTFKAFRQKDGLPNQSIMGILEDGHKKLWISTNKGISRFDPETLSFTNFTETDGLQGDQFNRWAFRRISTGEILFGGTNGFNLFHPDSIKPNTFKPPVYITDFRVFNKSIEIGEQEILKQNILFTKEIKLNYLQNIFSFEFAALNYQQPEKNQYRYKMEGFQNDWIDAGTDRKASYTNLSPGKYVFRVIASNNDGLWNEEGTAIKIIITPPYWQTWWFRTLAAFLVIALIYSLFKWRVSIIKKQKILLEDQVREKTAALMLQKEAVEAQAENMQALNEEQQAQTEFLQSLNEELQVQKEAIIAKQEEAEKARRDAERANQAKSIFLATMSHEIRTPMNGVLGIAALLAETVQTPEQQEYTDTIRTSGEALLTVINDILDFSKIESGNLELDNHSFDLRQCIEEVMDVFSAKASQKGLDLVYQIGYQIPAQIVGDSHRLRQILLNLISNAMKFTHQGEIFVNVELVKMGNGKLELAFYVKDSGIGIPKDKLSRLFKAFSQVDSSTTRKYGGTGLGLVISERLVQLMGGTISVESQEGVGTTFQFTINPSVSQETIRQYVLFNTQGNEGKKILLIDDNTTNLTILKNQLTQWMLSPTIALSGKQALEILSQSERFDLVITDMQMPDMDGLNLSQQIKAKYSLPIILLSSIGDESKRKYPELFTAVLNKPVKQQQLSRVIQAALRPDGLPAAVEDVKAKRVLSDEFATHYPLRILLAEDNIVNQKLTIRVLNKLGYKNIEIAQNGLEVLEKFNEEFFEVILMDVQMPEMDGLEATRMIRLKQYQQPVIISMTANAMSDDKEICLKAGMDGYISKPINLDELVDALVNAFEFFKRKATEKAEGL